MSALYDRIGINYAELPKPDPRIAKTIEQARKLKKRSRINGSMMMPEL